jgi:hypothetical protein
MIYWPGSRRNKGTVYLGLLQGLEEERGYFSQAEIKSLTPKTWEIKRRDLADAGRRKQ